jgi:hypothetical protein
MQMETWSTDEEQFCKNYKPVVESPRIASLCILETNALSLYELEFGKV